MRNQFFRHILPLGVGLMAFAFAFATESKTSSLDEESVLYIYSDLNECIPTEAECNNLGSTPCTKDGKEVFEFRNGTMCEVPLYHWNP